MLSLMYIVLINIVNLTQIAELFLPEAYYSNYESYLTNMEPGWREGYRAGVFTIFMLFYLMYIGVYTRYISGIKQVYFGIKGYGGYNLRQSQNGKAKSVLTM